MGKYTFLFFGLLLLTLDLHAQVTTYSPYEERMAQFVNNQLAYGRKYDSLAIIKKALDSCRVFLAQYPHTFVKSGILSYMVEMTAEITTDSKVVIPLVDSLLLCDSNAVTKYGIGQLLIEKNIEPAIGYKLLVDAYPNLTYSYHRFKANILFARLEISLGQTDAAKRHYEKALKFDSTRAEGWLEYATFLKFSEYSADHNIVMKKMQGLERSKLFVYQNNSNSNPNLNKSFLKYTFKDIDDNPVNFSSYSGEPVIIQNFNFWCPNPQEQINILKRIETKYPKIKIVLLNVGETPEELKTHYLTRSKYKFFASHKIIYGDSLFWSEIFGHTANSIFVIDKNGTIKGSYEGYSKILESLIVEKIEKLTQ